MLLGETEFSECGQIFLSDPVVFGIRGGEIVCTPSLALPLTPGLLGMQSLLTVTGTQQTYKGRY